jgi:hydrophobic/amphiphilic exporter-1 (mainly G- bacteria), HAE1 family
MSAPQLLHLALFGAVLMALARRLPAFAMRQSVTLGMIVTAIALFGAVALVRSPVELMPNVAYGNVTIFIDVRGGMPPPEIERLVTRPVEEAMGAISHLRNVISSSKKDRAVVTLEFEPGTDMDLAAMEVREKFLRVKPQLPSEIEKPIIARYEESDAPIVIAALTSDQLTPEALRRWVDADVKEKLLRVSGVANVEVGGGRERKIVVDLDRNRLASTGLSIRKVVSVLEENNLNLRTGDVAGSPSLVFGVRTLGAYKTLEDIRRMTLMIAPNGGRVRLEDIAEIKDSFLESESYSRLNARSAVTLYIQKESAANTVRVASAVERELTRFQGRLPAGVNLVTISNQKTSIVASIKAVCVTLLYGVALVVLVLPIFLAKTRLTRAIVSTLLALVVGNILLFFVMHWPLYATAWPVAILFAGMAMLATVRPDLRTSLVVAASIPVSVCMTLAWMAAEGVSINVMSLSGLILGIGLLVDNAVVVIEAYDRVVSTSPQLSLRQAMLQAAQEMVSPMLGGTMTIVVVFLPFSLLARQTQMLFAGISFVVTASLFSSLFVALTLVPALGSLIDPAESRAGEWDARWASWRASRRPIVFGKGLPTALPRKFFTILSFLIVGALVTIHTLSQASWLQSLYVMAAASVVLTGLALVPKYLRNLDWSFLHRRSIFAVLGTVFVAGVLIFMYSLPKDFVASSEQNEFVIFVELDTGVRLDISNRVAEEVEKAVENFAPTHDAIQHVSSKVEGWSSKIYVTLNDSAGRTLSAQEVINRLRPEVDRVMKQYEKNYKAFSYFSEPRTGKELFVEIFGYDYDVMARLAMDVAGRMGRLHDLSDVKIRYRPGRPELSVWIDSLRASLFGLDPQEIAETLHAQMRGLRATTFYDAAQEVETVVRLRPDQRETVEQLKNLLLTSGTGQAIPLEQVARIQGDLSPSEIWHRNRARVIQVSANLGSTSLETAAQQVRSLLKQVSFPSEYYADIGGQYEDMQAADREFWRALILTVFLVFAVMACQFESFAQPLVIMATVPLSAIGAVAALCLFGSTVTLGVSVGLLMLGGIVVNNGIMLIDRTNALRAAEPALSAAEAVRQAAQTRIRPIFMTKVTTVLGLLPMALDRSDGAVLWSPLAITVIGGLISSSLLTLFVVPNLFLLLESFRNRMAGWSFPRIAASWRSHGWSKPAL